MLLSVFTFAILLSSTICNEVSETSERGFGVRPPLSQNTPTNPKVPKHLQELLNNPNSGSNRIVSTKATSTMISKHKISPVLHLPEDSHQHGTLKDVELKVYLKPQQKISTLVITVLGTEQKFKCLLTIIKNLVSSLQTLDNVIRAERTLLSSHGIEVTSTLPINKVINLKEKPHLTLLYNNQEILEPSAKIARRHFLQMFGETHHLERRSASPHCKVQDLMVNFNKIGINSVVAPMEFNAHICSGECHLDHEETPMTNHAFIQNILYYSGVGGEVQGASCVSDQTKPLTVLIAVGRDFHLTVYEDMVVESCSCR
ncbi:LOW QUALITY PROTEIN: uncharacterized protein LOC134812574 [Bolinopsis microptera]|uniref:LOW QUALITY PROTEIN: uncharacterized protein LOC134812574 n=1 Tax=Bolinopsis microptera TaxID=2820187 RepID=UPI00307AACE4